MEVETTDRKIYRRRPMRGLKSDDPSWMDIESDSPLSIALDMNTSGKLYLCGSLQDMSREYVEEPLKNGWRFARPYIHKFRSPIFRPEKIEQCDHPSPRERADVCKPCDEQNRMAEEGRLDVSVKLVGESWLPGCESMAIAVPSWAALKAEWASETAIPLLSTPSKTGQAFLIENLPKGVDFPSLPDELAHLIRSISPQHRLEVFPGFAGDGLAPFGYDGRWMYAGASLADRLPVGEARKVGGFLPFQPGWHHVKIRVPEDWKKLGLIPRPCEHEGNRVWDYPSMPGAIIQAWVSEPELTLAIQNGWEIIHHIDGYAFDKGRPLVTWAKKLIGMRERLQDVVNSYGATPDTRSVYRFAAAAIREILNHTIGSFHVDTYEREAIVSQSEWKELIDQWGYEKVRTLEKLRSNKRRVIYPAKHSDRLSIYMPHWSAQIWALERAWIAKHALMCDPSTLMEIRGDCIYSSAGLSFKDDGHYSQLRPKVV